MDAPDNTVKALEEAIASLFAQRTGVVNELKRCNQKRRDLKEETKRVATAIREGRAFLDEYFEQEETTKKLRRDILAKIREIKGKVKGSKEVLARLEKTAPRTSGETLRKSIESFEWKLQAERLTREEEKKLVQRIKELEIQLRLWREAYSVREDLSKLLSEARELENRLDELNAARQGVRPMLDEKSKSIELLLRAREQLRGEWDAVMSDTKELEENLKRIDAELISLEERRRGLVRDRRETQRLEEKNRRDETLKQIKNEAQQKLARGEKVTFDQLKILFSEEQGESLK